MNDPDEKSKQQPARSFVEQFGREQLRIYLHAIKNKDSNGGFQISNLSTLVHALGDLLVEIDDRISWGEFSMADFQMEFAKRKLSPEVQELLKLLASLGQFKKTVAFLTDTQISDSSMPSSDVGSNEKIDIDRVLKEFEEVDVFAEYHEGDASYDKKYELEDKKILNELFFQILEGYVDPIVVGFRAVLGGNHSQKLFSAILASIKPLRRSAQTMGFHELRSTFEKIEEIFSRAIQSGLMNGYDRIHLIRVCGDMTLALPDKGKTVGFKDIMDADTANSSFVLSLTQSDEVETWMIQALMEVGINTKSRLFTASASEVFNVTGLPLETCERILRICREILV